MAKKVRIEVRSNTHDFNQLKSFAYDQLGGDVTKVAKVWEAISRIQAFNERETRSQHYLGYRDSQQFSTDPLVARVNDVIYKLSRGEYKSELSEKRALSSLLGAVAIAERKHAANLYKALTGESSAKDIKFTPAFLEASEMLYWHLNHAERIYDSGGQDVFEEFLGGQKKDNFNFLRTLKNKGLWDEMTPTEQELIKEGLALYSGN